MGDGGGNKNQPINSAGHVNSHWCVQIGTDHDYALGQKRSGAPAEPQ